MILIIIGLAIIALAAYLFTRKPRDHQRPSKPQNYSTEEEEPYYIYADADRLNEELLDDDFDDFE